MPHNHGRLSRTSSSPVPYLQWQGAGAAVSAPQNMAAMQARRAPSHVCQQQQQQAALEPPHMHTAPQLQHSTPSPHQASGAAFMARAASAPPQTRSHAPSSAEQQQQQPPQQQQHQGQAPQPAAASSGQEPSLTALLHQLLAMQDHGINWLAGISSEALMAGEQTAAQLAAKIRGDMQQQQQVARGAATQTQLEQERLDAVLRAVLAEQTMQQQHDAQQAARLESLRERQAALQQEVLNLQAMAHQQAAERQQRLSSLAAQVGLYLAQRQPPPPPQLAPQQVQFAAAVHPMQLPPAGHHLPPQLPPQQVQFAAAVHATQPPPAVPQLLPQLPPQQVQFAAAVHPMQPPPAAPQPPQQSGAAVLPMVTLPALLTPAGQPDHTLHQQMDIAVPLQHSMPFPDWLADPQLLEAALPQSDVLSLPLPVLPPLPMDLPSQEAQPQPLPATGRMRWTAERRQQFDAVVADQGGLRCTAPARIFTALKDQIPGGLFSVGFARLCQVPTEFDSDCQGL